MNVCKIRFLGAVCLAVLLAGAACSPITRFHGHVPSEATLSALQIGADTRDSVQQTVGPPTSEGTLEGGEWYYVATEVVHLGARTPKIKGREVVAISFNDAGVLQNIERFGLEDGRIVVLNRRVTASPVRGPTFLQQLFGTFGNIDTGAILTQQ